LIPGVALTLRHTDFFMNQQLKTFLDRYYYLLDSLKSNYRQTLRLRREYEKSIRDNEDGFFLQLYKVLCDAIFRVRLILQHEFHRQRSQVYAQSGGYSQVHHHKIARLMHDQYQVVSAVQKIVYLMAFEVFGIEEQVFRGQVEKEIK
jgi:hypothetical protein